MDNLGASFEGGRSPEFDMCIRNVLDGLEQLAIGFSGLSQLCKEHEKEAIDQLLEMSIGMQIAIQDTILLVGGDTNG